MASPARETMTDVRRRGDALAFALAALLDIAPTPPCSVCAFDPSGECALHRRIKTARQALQEWGK